MGTYDYVRQIARKPFIPYVVLIAGIITTFLVTLYISQKIHENDQVRFDAEALKTTQTIQTAIETYSALLRAGAGLFAAHTSVSNAQFADFVERLGLEEFYPGVQGIGYAVRISREYMSQLQARMQAMGVPQFTIYPSGTRAEYYPIIYLEPRDERNLTALGYDMFAEPVRREAMIQARDAGEPAMSGKVILVQETDEYVQPGFLIYHPIYAGGETPVSEVERISRLLGFVYGAFRAEDMFAGIFESDAERLVRFHIYDGREQTVDTLLYDSRMLSGVEADEAYKPQFSTTTFVTVAGHQWTLVFDAEPAFDAASDQWRVPFIFIGGLLLNGLLFGLSKFQQRAQIASEQIQQHKDEFMAMASHELKTPVTSIKAYAQILLSRFQKAQDTFSIELMEKMDSQLNKLADLISDLLDVTRVDGNRLEFRKQEFQLTDLIHEVVEEMQRTTKQHVISMELSVPVAVYADRDRIGQVLTNFLSNAIKYSPQADKIIVRTETSRQTVTCSVEDFGIGVPKEDKERIFERFYRSQNKEYNPLSGVGLGLYISSEIIRRHGGKIWVKSPWTKIRDKQGKEIEVGSRFSFTLPIARG